MKYACDRRLKIFGITLLIGAVFRVIHLFFFDVDSLHGKAGLFLQFARQIHDNGYIPPHTIDYYTGDGVPFLYPPLCFYLYSVLIYEFGISDYIVSNVIPPIISIFTIPYIYVLAKSFGFKESSCLIALAVFAVLPVAFREQVETEGLAEAFGTLTFIWVLIALLKTWKAPTTRNIFGTGFTIGLSILSSPGGGYAAIMSLLAFIFKGVTHNFLFSIKKYFKALVGIATVSVLVISPYLSYIILNHNLYQFYASFTNQHDGSGFIASYIYRLATFQFAENFNLFWWNFIIALGLIITCLNPKYRLLLILFLLTALIPREEWLICVPATLLAVLGINELISIFGKITKEFNGVDFRKTVVTLLLVSNLCVLSDALLSSPLHAFIGLDAMLAKALSLDTAQAEAIGLDTIQAEAMAQVPSVLAAMSWVGENTSQHAKFVVIVNPILREWAPYKMQRAVLNVPEGTEFDPKDAKTVRLLNENLDKCQNIKCYYVFIKEFSNEPIYLLINNKKLEGISEDKNISLTNNLTYSNDLFSIVNFSNVQILSLEF